MKGSATLLLAAGLSAAVALLHVIIVFVGAPGYRYFGAGEEMARRAESGSAFPGLLTTGIAAVFAVFAFYALAGAGVAPRPPLLRTGLLVIGTIYTLRGLVLVQQLALRLSEPGRLPPRHLAFSAVSLVIGLVYLAGLARAWNRLAGG